MPNWVTINVHVTGDEKVLEEFASAHIVPNNDEDRPEWAPAYNFDFNTIIPMPCAVRNTTSPCRPDEETIQAKNTRLYGAGNWYDWAVKHWDTKWNACETHVSYEHAGDMEFSIQTAWSLPIKIFEELSELYPELTFDIDCVEEGGFFSGQMTFDGNTVLDNLTDDEETWKEQASKLNGYEFDE